MNQPEHAVTFALKNDFKGARTLLLIGDNDGFAHFARNLSSLSGGPVDSRDLALLAAGDMCRLRLWLDGKGSFVVDAGDGSLDWYIGADAMPGVVAALEELAGPSHEPGHVYLETKGDIQILASAGEYGQDKPSSNRGDQ